MDHNGNATALFLDSGQYTADSILDYELVYGKAFVSPGGKACADDLIQKMPLDAGDLVLDAGCGLGGSAFLMASKFGLRVDAIDLSENMIALAQDRLRELGYPKTIQLKQADCLQIDAEQKYNGIYSRDVFLHIPEKQKLFSVLHRALKLKGQLLFTDYCCASPPWDETFSAYVEKRGYDLQTVADYSALLDQAGFQVIEALDRTEDFINFSEQELARIETLNATPSVKKHLASDWLAKIQRARDGNQRWGQFLAIKITE